MSEPSPAFVVRRILVAVDASPDSLEALDAAAELAARLQAELLGLFVEDINLLRLARLPFARQVSRLSGMERPFDEADLQAEIRALAAQARAALMAAVGRQRVKASFRVVRGSVSAEVVAAADEADLLILGWGRRPLSRRPRLGGTARAAAQQVAKPVLLAGPGLSLGRLVVVYEDSAGAERALAAGLALAESGGGELEVLVSASSPDEATRLGDEATARVSGHGVSVRLRFLAGSPGEALRDALREAEQGLLVVSADSPLLGREAAGGILEESGRPVLLVR